jgi:signal transduction histidine kinase
VIGSYILGYSIRSVILILLVSTAVGLVAIWYITNKLNKIITGIKKFQEGHLSTRIPVKSDGELDRIGVVFNDMAGEIERNIEKLKGIDELRKELISNVSHDLRTPVASIQGYAETLMLKSDRLAKKEQRQYAEIIYQSCDRLRRRVDELFELSKLEANQVQLKTEMFSVAELTSDIANKFRIISGKKGVSINTFISKDIPAIEADISLIDRVLQNLIDNAIRFCHEGDAINIEISLSNPGRVRISISDTGEGISQDDLPNIFERYYKGSRSHVSTGLGLAIVKKIIDLHNTHIDVSSLPGKGTTFTFELPAAQVA